MSGNFDKLHTSPKTPSCYPIDIARIRSSRLVSPTSTYYKIDLFLFRLMTNADADAAGLFSITILQK